MKVRTGKYSAAPGVDGIGRGGPCLITDHNTWSQEGEDSLGMILSNGSGSLHFTGFSQNVLWGEQGTLKQYSSLRHGLGMQTSNGEQRCQVSTTGRSSISLQGFGRGVYKSPTLSC